MQIIQGVLNAVVGGFMYIGHPACYQLYVFSAQHACKYIS